MELKMERDGVLIPSRSIFHSDGMPFSWLPVAAKFLYSSHDVRLIPPYFCRILCFSPSSSEVFFISCHILCFLPSSSEVFFISCCILCFSPSSSEVFFISCRILCFLPSSSEVFFISCCILCFLPSSSSLAA